MSIIDNSGKTALHCATESHGGKEAVRLLVEGGSIFQSLTVVGKLHCTTQRGCREQMRRFNCCSGKERISQLLTTAEKQHCTTRRGAYEGNEVVQLLLDQGADILARDINCNGRTAMDEAVTRGGR